MQNSYRNKRYCCVKLCQYFSGTSDTNVRFFCAPKDADLRAEWEQALNKEPNGNFLLCSSHFREEDILSKGVKIGLKKGAIPIPIIVPKTEVSSDMFMDTVMDTIKIVDIAKIKNNVSDKTDLCQSCLNYDVQLQAARMEIAQLKKRNNELALENKKMKIHIQRPVNSNDNINKPLFILLHKKKCSFCKIEMSTSEFERHVCIDQEIIFCPLCPKSNPFKSIDSFLKHVTQHDEMVYIDKRLLYKCDQCNVGYPIEILLECHKKSHENIYKKAKVSSTQSSAQTSSVGGSSKPIPENNKFFKCGVCDMAFGLPKALAQHMSGVHVKKQFQCYICKIDSLTAENLRAHMKKIHRRDFKCEICKMALTLNELNTTHMCGDEKRIRCDYCPIEFTTTPNLLEHLKNSHEQKKFYKCEKCPKFFPMIVLKEYHMKTHEQDLPRIYRCKKCSKRFRWKSCLIVHSASCKSDNSILCDECGKCFKTAQSLELHKTSFIHSNEAKFQCPECPKKFAHKGNLYRHSNMHRADKYVCEICGTELLSTNGYNKHMQNHQSERTEADRKFACKLCPKKFFTRKHLIKHQLVHTNSKLFSCQFCSQSYKYSGDLHKHLRTHLGNKIYECPKCSKRFQYQIELKKHEFEHYKEEKEAKVTTDEN